MRSSLKAVLAKLSGDFDVAGSAVEEDYRAKGGRL